MSEQQMMEEIDRLARLCEEKDAELKTKQRHIDGLIGADYVIAKKLSEAQAQIAIQAEALKEIAALIPRAVKGGHVFATEFSAIDNALSATSETVAAWRAKETEPLRMEITRLAKAEVDLEVKLHDAQNEAINEVIDYIEKNCQLYAGQDIADMLRETKLNEENNSMTKLRREVAMLINAGKELCKKLDVLPFNNQVDSEYVQLRDAMYSAKATALAYEREIRIDERLYLAKCFREHDRGVLASADQIARMLEGMANDILSAAPQPETDRGSNEAL